MDMRRELLMDTKTLSSILDELYFLCRRIPNALDNLILFSVLRSKILNQVDFEESFYVPESPPGLYVGQEIYIKGFYADGDYNIHLGSHPISRFYY